MKTAQGTFVAAAVEYGNFVAVGSDIRVNTRTDIKKLTHIAVVHIPYKLIVVGSNLTIDAEAVYAGGNRLFPYQQIFGRSGIYGDEADFLYRRGYCWIYCNAVHVCSTGIGIGDRYHVCTGTKARGCVGGVSDVPQVGKGRVGACSSNGCRSVAIAALHISAGHGCGNGRHYVNYIYIIHCSGTGIGIGYGNRIITRA